MTAPAVEFVHVDKRYGAVAAVNDVSFEIAPGTLVTLLGPSGCGKTSTLRLIAGLEQPTGGAIRIGGRDVTRLSAAERDVSMVFQSYALFPHMTVMENVCYGLRASGMPTAKAKALAAEKLAVVGLAGFEARLPSELSGGQQQRVAVARAIVLEPQVLLFDEPLSNLDAKLRRRVREDIRALQQELKLTVVYVTHDQEEALAVSDRIVVMHSARIVQDGTPRDLYERPANSFIADFIGNANLLPVTVAAPAGDMPDDMPGDMPSDMPGDMADVTLGAVTLRLPHRGHAAGPALLAVRPQSFRLHPGPPAPGEVAGTVQKSAYLGGHMEYEILLEGTDQPALVMDGNVATPLLPGDTVGVAIGAASVVARA